VRQSVKQWRNALILQHVTVAGAGERRALLLSPRMESSSISSKARTRVSRRQRPQKVPPPRLLPLTRWLDASLSTFRMLTPDPMFTSRYGYRSLSAATAGQVSGCVLKFQSVLGQGMACYAFAFFMLSSVGVPV